MTEKKKLMIYSTGMVFYLACQWLCVVLVSNLLGNRDAGIYNLAISISNPFSAIALYGIRPYQVSDIKDRFSSRIYTATRVVTAALAFVLCAGQVMIAGYPKETALCILAYMFLRVAEAAVDVFQGMEQKGDRMDAVGVSFYLRSLASLGGFLITWFVTGSLLAAMLAMPVLSFAVVLFYDMPLSAKLASVRPQFDAKQIATLLWICLPLTLNTFFVSELATIPRTILEESWGEEMLGIYGAIAAPSVIVQTAGSFLFNPVIPTLAEDLAAGERKRFFGRGLKYLGLLFALTAFCVVGAAIFGRLGLRILFPGNPTVGEHVGMLIPTIICSGLVTGAWLFATLLIVLRDFKSILLGDLIALAVCVLSCRAWIPSMGMPGVTLAWGVALTVQMILFALISWKKACGKKDDFHESNA